MSDKTRLLNDLRVIDLRAELEKRNLDKSGVRGVLIQRLSKYLEEEGHDPATFKFDLSADSEQKSTPVKKTRKTESTMESENAVKEEAAEEETNQAADESANTEDNAQLAENTMEVDSAEKIDRKRELQDDSEAPEIKKSCIDKEEDHKSCIDKEEDHKENTDADDSINLDIGDDELLNDEPDTSEKQDKNDEADAEEENKPALEESTAEDTAAASDGAAADGQQVKPDAAATSNDGDNTEKEKDDKNKSDSDDKKDKKDESKESGARNLWVSGLSGDTRAKDLKQLCSKHGKVIGAKVVTNARTPGSRCYGYVTMASVQDAENCIKSLHRTELHGRMISVEKAKSEAESSSRRQPSRSERRSSKDGKENEEGKENEDGKDDENKEKKEDGTESNRSTSRTREKSQKSDKDKGRRGSKSHERRKSPREVLSFQKIWKERSAARARERSRAAREEERRRRAAEDALRERERRQRQEKHRLALEREKLRAERERIEREKSELLRLERERHRLEREKLELERLELKRAQLRLEEERRKRGYEGAAAYRKPAASPPLPEPAYERHKRAPAAAMATSRGQFDAPPPPRFELPASYDRTDKRERDREYKREYPRHVSSGNIKYPSNGTANDDARQPMPPGTRPKEPSRSYDSRDSRAYRPSPPTKPESRSWNATSRYPDAAAPSKGSGETWSSNEPRYGSSSGYEPRYQGYQPPPPGATYPDRYAPTREYRKY